MVVIEPRREPRTARASPGMDRSREIWEPSSHRTEPQRAHSIDHGRRAKDRLLPPPQCQNVCVGLSNGIHQWAVANELGIGCLDDPY
jgi:hypothetical protein